MMIERPQLWFIIGVTAIPSFLFGSLVSLYVGLDGSTSSNHVNDVVLEARVQQRIQQLREDMDQKRKEAIHEQFHALEAKMESGTLRMACDSHAIIPPDHYGKFVVDFAQVPKDEFVQLLNPGVPLDPSQAGADRVLILYSNDKAMPNKTQNHHGPNDVMTVEEALQNCGQVNVILADNSGHRRQCLALVPQYESYHIQKWMRLDPMTGTLSLQQPLQLVSRGHIDKGKEEFKPPRRLDLKLHWDILKRFFDSVDVVMAELKPILQQIARNNTVIVMVANFGQSELLMNFVCAARARNLDLSSILVFTTDAETTEIANGLGLATYFDQRNFGKTPTEAAVRYGDRAFSAMMIAKVICVQLVSMLGFDFLFQDLDIVWFKDPLEFFLAPDGPTAGYDIAFQDDGGHSVRYAPYSANSGFYFVRNNPLTKHFLTSILMSASLIIRSGSHQQVLISTLQEHVSLHGLKAKVLSRDTEEFPGGYHFNQRGGQFMHDFYNNKVHPIIFHMSWTLNKDNKILYFRQMGEWFVRDTCIARKRSDITADQSSDLSAICCAAEPLVSCHYRDKPSKIPCKDSPNIDVGRPSFW